jgi:anti-sigma-K factor RskA
MAHERIHELTAAYALDALEEAEEREYEDHLGSCERCQNELAGFRETATSLAYAVEAPEPPPRLRERILEQARAERSKVIPFRPRRGTQAALGAVAAIAAVVALAIGLWANSVSNELDAEREALRVLADPQAESIALQGASGRLVVTPERDAALVVAGLGAAPSGKAYEVWVIEDGTPRPAGLFDGDEDRDVVRLDRKVPSGATVAVTLEDDQGVDRPTGRPVLSADA